jgi:Protein of unknown function (DUF3891)
MVIGWLAGEPEDEDVSSVWARVEAAQRRKGPQCLLTPQPAHAVLAGELAAGLLPSAFGELPVEITRAIQMHDAGWAASDAQQIQRLRSGGPQSGKAVPVSFLDISPAEMVEAWTASVDSAEVLSKAGAVIVSRHFSLLAHQDEDPHQHFIEAEKIRRQRLERSIGHKAEDLGRWTAALGFCDLVSLALLSGVSGQVEFPLAHPASPQTRTAPRVALRIDGRKLHFTPATVRAGSTLSIQALKHPVPAQGARAEAITWEVE